MQRFRSLLRLLERYTKTDLGYLARGGFWLTLDEVIGSIVALGLSIAFAHFLPKEVYGTYRFLIALFWTLTACTVTGLPTAISQAVARGHEGAFRSSFSFSIRWSIPFALLALCGSGYYFYNANTELGLGLLIIAAFGPFMQTAYLWGPYCMGNKKFDLLAVCGIVFSIFPALTLLITMYFFRSPLMLLLSYLAGSVVVGLLISLFIFVRYRPNREQDVEFQTVRWHFSAMNLLATIAQQVDKIVVFHYLGAIDLAIYAFATALPEQVKNVLNTVSTLAFPKFVQRPFADIQRNFWYRLWGFTGLLVLAALAYALAAPFIFDLFFPAYHDAIFYSQIFALSLIPIGSALPTALLQAQNAKRELYILNVLGPMFQIGTLVILTSTYGLIGTLIARIASRAWSFILASILVKVYMRRRSLLG